VVESCSKGIIKTEYNQWMKMAIGPESMISILRLREDLQQIFNSTAAAEYFTTVEGVLGVGVFVWWCVGVLVWWCGGVLVCYWCVGVLLVCWCVIGVLVCYWFFWCVIGFFGVLVYWCIGVLRAWCVVCGVWCEVCGVWCAWRVVCGVACGV
jgi:hypothetical protein